jgi:hypothetical protein
LKGRKSVTTQPFGSADRHDGIGLNRRPLAALSATVAVLAVSVAMTISASPVQAASVVSAASAPCSPKNSTIDGGPAVSYCGPATATLVVKGKTYSFKNGYCQSIHVSGITVDITLGTIAQGKTGTGVPGNAGKPYFRLDLAPGQNSDLLGAVDFGGKKLTSGGVVSAAGTIASNGGSKGTFKTGKGAYDASGKPFSVSGSWNCHGAFAKN